MTAAGTLYLVATPIGNLEDITHRALRTLAEVDLIACEDTRRTGTLLERYRVKSKMISYHEHNEHERAAELVGRLQTGTSIALVTDAGTPGISDPGYRLVRLCIESEIKVVPLPGAAAFVLALTASGLPTDTFFFGGFLPARANTRRTRLADLRTLPATLIFYEAPHRIHHALSDAREILGEREATVARELTKLHEEFRRGRLSELAAHFAHEEHRRGEMILLIDRTILESDLTVTENESVLARVNALEAQGHDPRQALRQVARELKLPRAEAYRRLTAERNRRSPES